MGKENNITEEISFRKKVIPTKKTVKLPVQLNEVDLESGNAIMECVCFKAEDDKNDFLSKKDAYLSDLKKLDEDTKKFEDDFQTFKDSKLDVADEIEMRKTLRDRRDELRDRARSIKPPMIDPEVAMVGRFKVKIGDVSNLISLADQIKD